MGPLIRAVNERNLIHDDSPNIDLFDLDRLEKRLKNVLEHLPDWTHGVAIKVHHFTLCITGVLFH